MTYTFKCKTYKMLVAAFSRGYKTFKHIPIEYKIYKYMSIKIISVKNQRWCYTGAAFGVTPVIYLGVVLHRCIF